MIRRRFAFLVLLSAIFTVKSLSQQQENLPVLDGYITRGTSRANFDVNGFHILSGKKTAFLSAVTTNTRTALGPDPLYIGEEVEIFGKLNNSKKQVLPAYQRALPDSDLTKILFKFQLIDGPGWHDAITLPTGIILVPRQIVERLPNDSQLATVLADNIATALEKQCYIAQPKYRAMLAANVMGGAGGFFVPGLGLATDIATVTSSHVIQTRERDQSGRVSLALLHDANYDIDQAPLAWWLLAAKPQKDIVSTSMPDRSANLYRSLGRVWQRYPNWSAAAQPQRRPRHCHRSKT